MDRYPLGTTRVRQRWLQAIGFAVVVVLAVWYPDVDSFSREVGAQLFPIRSTKILWVMLELFIFLLPLLTGLLVFFYLKPFENWEVDRVSGRVFRSDARPGRQELVLGEGTSVVLAQPWFRWRVALVDSTGKSRVIHEVSSADESPRAAAIAREFELPLHIGPPGARYSRDCDGNIHFHSNWVGRGLALLCLALGGAFLLQYCIFLATNLALFCVGMQLCCRF